MLTCSDYPPPGNTVVGLPVDLGPQGYNHLEFLTQADSFGPGAHEHKYPFAGDFRSLTNGDNVPMYAGTSPEPGNVGDTFRCAVHPGGLAHLTTSTSPALFQVSYPRLWRGSSLLRLRRTL